MQIFLPVSQCTVLLCDLLTLLYACHAVGQFLGVGRADKINHSVFLVCVPVCPCAVYERKLSQSFLKSGSLAACSL